MIRKGLQIGHNGCLNAGLDKSAADMKGNLDFIFATKCSLDDIREVSANSRRWPGVRTRQVSNVDLVLPSGPTGVDPSKTSFFQLLSIGTKLVGPGASEIVLGPATVALVDGASVFIFSAIFQEVGTFHLAFDTNAFTLGSTGDVVLVSPAIFNVVAPDSEEPISCFLTLVPRVMFLVKIVFYVNERVGASTDGSIPRLQSEGAIGTRFAMVFMYIPCPRPIRQHHPAQFPLVDVHESIAPCLCGNTLE